MRDRRRSGIAGMFLAILMLMGAGSLLSACNTVAGAGQDVSTTGRTVTTGAEQTKQALTVGTAFDGTYRFISSTKVNPLYTSNKGDMAPCPDRAPGPLTIVQGHARYTTETGYELQGTVGPHGELEVRVMAVGGGGSRPLEMDATGSIDAGGTVHARQRASACSYDFVWQK